MEGNRHIAIFTTASLPWMTGTAINPLFRAAYLAKDGGRKVTLVIPWLSLYDQELVYPKGLVFASPEEQEEYVWNWLDKGIGFTPNFILRFYPGKFSKDKRSILPVGDLSAIIPDDDADIAVLEEPEHLTWYHHGRRWKSKFQRVFGIVHTNYLEYVKREKNGLIQAFLLKYINSWVTRIYCHKIIRLSAATQEFPRSIVCNVHGVNPKFIDIGKTKLYKQQAGERAFTKGAYYIGKMVWSKGYRELIHLFKENQHKLCNLEMDLYGNGEDSGQVQQAADKLKLTIRVHPGQDHADSTFHHYKVFINPSTSDVVCTTTAEALAMGKIVVCAKHPSNAFFKQFSNCRMYENNEGFVKETMRALSDEPTPLTDKERHELSWEAATERFLKVADLTQIVSEKSSLPSNSKRLSQLSFGTRNMRRKVEDGFASMHYSMFGNETLRRLFGAIPGSLQPDEQQSKELRIPFPQKKFSLED